MSRALKRDECGDSTAYTVHLVDDISNRGSEDAVSRSNFSSEGGKAQNVSGSVSAGVEQKIDIRIGKAVESLEALISCGESESYDFAYIDANKEEYDEYYERCLRLVKPNGIIAFDNTLQGGRVFDDQTTEESALAMRALNAKLKSDERVQLSMLPFGDGVNIVLKL